MNSRYIYMEFTGYPKGLLNCIALQKHLLRYAAGMQRIAVIPDQFPFHRKHNRGHDIDCKPYLYYDFDHTVYFSSTDKTRKPLYYDFNHTVYFSSADKTRKPLQCIQISDLNMSQFSEKDIKVFKAQDGPAHITKEDENYRLIIIEHATWNWIHTCDYQLPHNISFPYSERVRSTAMQVINQMMGSQKNWNHRLSGSIEDSHLRLNYCCVHARRTDRLKGNWSITMPMNIKRNLDANQDIDSNTLIYLMTDEPNDHFYDKLKKYYPNLFRYSDFPELYHLRYPADGADPNNYLLFAIESQIQSMARISYKPNFYRLKNGKTPWQWWFWSKEKVDERCLLKQYDDLFKQVLIELVEFYPLRKDWRKFVSVLIPLMKTLYSLIKRIRKSIAFRLTKLKKKVRN